ETVREPSLHRYRRAARVSRRLWQSPDERLASSAPHLSALQIEADHHVLVGDDRQSARACRSARRAAVRAGVRERRTAWREVLSVREPTGRQRATGYPQVVPGGTASRRRGVREAQAADDRLRAKPAGD